MKLTAFFALLLVTQLASAAEPIARYTENFVVKGFSKITIMDNGEITYEERTENYHMNGPSEAKKLTARQVAALKSKIAKIVKPTTDYGGHIECLPSYIADTTFEVIKNGRKILIKAEEGCFSRIYHNGRNYEETLDVIESLSHANSQQPRG